MPLRKQPICYCLGCDVVQQLAKILADRSGTDTVHQLEKRLVRGGFRTHIERVEWMASRLAAAIWKSWALHRLVVENGSRCE
jgi:hypothetical protein